MAAQKYPLLLFPSTSPIDRDGLPPGFSKIHLPAFDRQQALIIPKFQALKQTFDAKRFQLQQSAPGQEPELVVVFETIGSVDAFIKAAKHITGLEWLLESATDIAPDDDFYDNSNKAKSLSGRLFLIGSNQQALTQILALWEQYKANPAAQMQRGFAPWKQVFAQLKDVRFWSIRDRLGLDAIEYWKEQIDSGIDPIRFEIEIWHYPGAIKNNRARDEVNGLVTSMEGRVLNHALISDIGYHGMLVEMPLASVAQLLDDSLPNLVMSERIMFFRPKGQAAAPTINAQGTPLSQDVPAPVPAIETPPIVALLDGLPLQNHPLLRGRLMIDDPDGWEESYSAQDRVHGTAMASLITRGDLNSAEPPLLRQIYVRPVLKPDLRSPSSPRPEVTPNDKLLIDLMHRAVKRIFESEGGEPAVAPTVKIINISLGDSARPFDRHLSPWARLLDWLAFKYRVLFIISAGNEATKFTLKTPRETLENLPLSARHTLALTAMYGHDVDRTILSPAEAINGLTIGAHHSDWAQFPAVSRRYDLFPAGGLSPYSRIGTGYRRAIKPDLLFPGGRMLFREEILSPVESSLYSPLWNSHVEPGHKVAGPPVGLLNQTKHTRGTSNAAALASRSAAIAYETIETIRAETPDSLPNTYDAVLIKALLAHGARWGDLFAQITTARPDITDRDAQRKLAGRWLGYGIADIQRALICTEQRATMIGVGELTDGKAYSFTAPLPPSLAAKVLWKRMTITLAWITPINSAHQAYRRAKLWVTPPAGSLGVARQEGEWRQVQRGTLQHEVLEGTQALAFVDGDKFVCKVNCKAEAGDLKVSVPFAICVSLEVAEGVNVPIYQEIKDRLKVKVGIQG